MRVISRCAHNLVPWQIIGSAHLCRKLRIQCIVDRELEGDCVPTTLGVSEDKVMINRGGVTHSISIPGKTLASNNCCIRVRAIVDREMKSYCIGTKSIWYQYLLCCT